MRCTRWLAILIMAATLSCNGDKDITGPRGPVIFEISPIEYAAISLATPLGNLNPPGHTFPSNHMGFYLKGDAHHPVKAHASGTVSQLHYNEGFDDYAIQFKHTATFYSYLDHVENPRPSIKVGARVQAGDSVGMATSYLDIGVIDYDTTRHFIIPGRYHENSLHCGNVYLYFAADVREHLLAKNTRTSEPRGGKIDFDIDGALSGNWFLEGTPVTWEASSWLYGDAQIAFVYDMWEPEKIRIVCGGSWNGAPFCDLVNGNTPDPAGVTQASGFVKYQSSHGGKSYVTAVQLLEKRKIKVEIFENKTAAAVSNFTANAKIYVR